MSDCTCHESCGSCGYSEDPTGSDDCLTCSDPIYEFVPRGDVCMDDESVSDLYDYTCSFYNDEPELCGYYDTEDFMAIRECCVCRGINDAGGDMTASAGSCVVDGMIHGCYGYPFDSIFEACECHESCGACGYYYDPQSTF